MAPKKATLPEVLRLRQLYGTCSLQGDSERARMVAHFGGAVPAPIWAAHVFQMDAGRLKARLRRLVAEGYTLGRDTEPDVKCTPPAVNGMLVELHLHTFRKRTKTRKVREKRTPPKSDEVTRKLKERLRVERMTQLAERIAQITEIQKRQRNGSEGGAGSPLKFADFKAQNTGQPKKRSAWMPGGNLAFHRTLYAAGKYRQIQR